MIVSIVHFNCTLSCIFKNLFFLRIVNFLKFFLFDGFSLAEKFYGGKQVWLGKNLLVLQGERVKIAYVHILGPTFKLAVEKSLLNNILLLDNYLFF